MTPSANPIQKVRKRDSSLADFDQARITNAIFKALTSTGEAGKEKAEQLSDKVVKLLERRFKDDQIPEVEQVQDIIEEVLMLEEFTETAKAFILYREQRRRIREAEMISDEAVEIFEKYIGEIDWQVKENANMAYSLQGLNHYAVSTLTKRYWLNKIYPKTIRECYDRGDFHIHNLDCLATYCNGWDLYDLLLRGFGGVVGKVECASPKHLRSALGQTVNFFYTLQGESSGAQAFSSFDTLLAPFVRYDKLDYPQVKQAMQEFLFNCAVPTRVGFQCLSEDTKILAFDGWKTYKEVQQGDIIYTFNIQGDKIEPKIVDTVFAREYEGIMYNLKNRSQDQLISPNHRIVRQIFSAPKYIMEPIEEILKLKTGASIPTAASNDNPDYPIDDSQLKLIAWTLSEGTIEKDGSHRVTIYQSPQAHPHHYQEIIGLLNCFDFDYTERMHSSLGTCCQMRLSPTSSKVIHQWIGGTIKKIPDFLYKLSQKQAKLFLQTYVKGDGWTEKYRQRITVTDTDTLEGLQIIAVLAGYNFNVKTRKPQGISKKVQHILTLTESKHDHIQQITTVNYKGVIWSVHTANETVIAERNGQVFITGNTPFSNLTLDISPSPSFASQAVIIGGKPQQETYGEFQEEMKILDKAFFEVMMEGDKNGRPFTFPIPTINITKDFPWDNPNLDLMWQATAKYGVNYFANFIQSDMKPEDVRSMCCRLRLNNKELYSRGGGLFGANPLTGAIGVVTINLPRIGYLTKTKREFFERLSRIMDEARDSLEIKRKALEDFMRKGLYPYSRHYLAGIEKMRGAYYSNHFSTIGLVGLNECLLNFMGESIGSKNGRAFALEVLDFMRKMILQYQEQTGNLFNLEATPAEGTSYSLALKDKKQYPNIITAGTNEVPYYTNSSQLPVNFTDDIFQAIELQDALQCKYTGGCIEKGNKVLTDKGLLPIENIVENFTNLRPIRTLSYNPDKKISEWDEVIDVMSIDVEKHNKIRIKGEKGLDITTSDWHPFFVLERVKVNPHCPLCEERVGNVRGFAVHLRWNTECRNDYQQISNKYKVVEKRADELRVGNYILQNSFNVYQEKATELNNDLLWLIGFFIGDGCISEYVDNRGGNNLIRHKVRFFSEHERVLEKVVLVLNRYFDCHVSVIKNDKKSELLREVVTAKENIAEFFLKYGFRSGQKVYNVSVGQEIKKNLNKENVFAFLSGLMDSDGYIDKRDGSFEYYTVSSQLADDILEICSKAGLMISKSLKITKRENEVNIWRLRIPQYELTRIKESLSNVSNRENIHTRMANRKKRYLPVVRVKEISKVDVEDNKFYDLTTKNNHNYLAGKNCLVFIHNTVQHLFLGEQISDIVNMKALIKKVFERFHLPYITLTPTFSICPSHGYLSGEHWKCPKCTIDQPCEVYSRVVGYIRPVIQWHKGKAQEFKDRKTFAVPQVLQQNYENQGLAKVNTD